jgi:hypothetical protein
MQILPSGDHAQFPNRTVLAEILILHDLKKKNGSTILFFNSRID